MLGSEIDVFLKWSTGLKCGKYCLELSFAVFLTSSVFATSWVLPGSLFEVILVPSWHQVGSKALFLGHHKNTQKTESKTGSKMKKKSPKVTPPPPPYPGRATPAHPQSRVSAKALESLLKLCALPWYTLLTLCSHAGSADIYVHICSASHA